MKYMENARRFADANLQNAGTTYVVETAELSDEQIASLSDLGYDVEAGEIGLIWADILTLCEAKIDQCMTEPSHYSVEDAEEVLGTFIKDSENYLVFAKHCRWNGANGYKFATTRSQLVSRPDDTTITPLYGSSHGKTLICREASHDVPTGTITIMIALTDAEYRRLQNASFLEVEDWAEQHYEKAVRHSA